MITGLVQELVETNSFDVVSKQVLFALVITMHVKCFRKQLYMLVNMDLLLLKR